MFLFPCSNTYNRYKNAARWISARCHQPNTLQKSRSPAPAWALVSMDRIRLGAAILLIAFLLLRLSSVPTPPPRTASGERLATATATATASATATDASSPAAADAFATTADIGAAAATTASEPPDDPRLARCRPGLPITALTHSLDPHALHALQAARDADLSAIALDRVFSDKQYRRWPGVNINSTAMLHFARDVIAPYRHEFAAFNEYPPCGVGPSGKHKHCLDSSRFQGAPEYTYYRNNGMYEGTCPIEVPTYLPTPT